MDPELLKKVLMRRLGFVALVVFALAIAIFTCWYIVVYAPKPSSPAELSPAQQMRYCEMRCAATCRQCESTCLRSIPQLGACL